MENVLKAARLLAPMYHGSNTLYKDEQEEMYLLALARSDHSAADFNRICNMLSEYGAFRKSVRRNFRVPGRTLQDISFRRCGSATRQYLAGIMIRNCHKDLLSAVLYK